MKICSQCKTSKKESDFNKRSRSSDGLASCCKQCKRSYDNLQYQNSEQRRLQIKFSNRKRIADGAVYIRQYLEIHPCVDCGLSDPELLEFDHVRGNKIAGVGRLVQIASSINTIQAEIDKCEVRCLHCHRKKTIKSLGWYKAFSFNPV